MTRSKLSYRLGNWLMGLSILALAFIYYPLLAIYLNPPKLETNLPQSGFFITIPKIAAQAPVLENVDAFNEVEYRKVLEQGVAHAKQSSLPGSGETVYLFAHSSDSPWRITRYNTIFLRLGELEKGDQIRLTKDSKQYLYQVVDKKELWPNQVQYLLKDSGNKLILQTCTPVGTALKRLLVFADLI